MGEQLYSAEEAAQILGLQVRTVRNYVRDGRLPGVRIGKQYRIARTDLEAFTGGGRASPVAVADSSTPHGPTGDAGTTLEVSSVAQVNQLSLDRAERIMRTLTAAMAGRGESEPVLRVEPLYDEDRRRLKVIVVGGVADTLEFLRIIDAVARDAD